MRIIHATETHRRPRGQHRYVRLNRPGYTCIDCNEPIIRDRDEDKFFCQVCGESYSREEFRSILARNILIIRNRDEAQRQKFQESHRLHKIATQRNLMDIVYYLQFGDRIKIGTTTDMQSRMTSLPWDVVLAIEPGGRTLETQRHQQFAAYRIRGEWFRMGEELMNHIVEVREQHAEHVAKRYKGSPQLPWGKGTKFHTKYDVAYNLLSEEIDPMPVFEESVSPSGSDLI